PENPTHVEPLGGKNSAVPDEEAPGARLPDTLTVDLEGPSPHERSALAGGTNRKPPSSHPNRTRDLLPPVPRLLAYCQHLFR
ncbi:MAG: hypothetical protein AAFR40_16590, partial [Pseudomonadota bacterium]